MVLPRWATAVLGLLASCALGVLTMSLWAELHVATSENGQFPGMNSAQMLSLLQHVHTHDNLRFLSDGTPVNLTQSDLFERSFRDSHGLSEEQFTAIIDMYDRSDLRQSWGDMGGVPAHLGGVQNSNMRRCFVADRTRCCGLVCRVRWLTCTVYERDNVYEAYNLIKDCRHGCKTRYFFDRRILSGAVGGEPCRWYVYPAWVSGEVPQYISTKSGHAVFSTSFLTSVAVQQASSRAAFQTQANVHNNTVRRERGGTTVPLTGSVIIEALTLFAALKHKQCRGPWLWVPPPGERVVADRPCEVSIIDMKGGLSGCNHWVGLRLLIDEVVADAAREAMWTKHQCSLCCQSIQIDGVWKDIRAVVADGLTALKFAKCSFYDCRQDILPGAGQRYCAFHDAEHGDKCAVNSPQQCPNSHEPDRLTCEYHRPWEDTYHQYYRRGSYHATAQARAAGTVNEPAFITYLRSMFATRFIHGYMIASFGCGIVAGLAPLWESEGDQQAAWALNEIFRHAQHLPDILFYDRSCFRRRWLINNPDPFWFRTICLVDRWHFYTHTQHDCGEFCSPEKVDCPLLWRADGDRAPIYRWNSSRAESTNSWIFGLGNIVKPMPRGLNQMVLGINVSVYNETLLGGMMHRNPTFRV